MQFYAETQAFLSSFCSHGPFLVPTHDAFSPNFTKIAARRRCASIFSTVSPLPRSKFNRNFSQNAVEIGFSPSSSLSFEDDSIGGVDIRQLSFKLRDARTPDDVESIFKDFKPLPPPVYSSLIKGFGIEKHLDPVFALMDWLRKKRDDTDGRVSPNIFIYNSLLGALKHSKQFEKVEDALKEIKLHRIAPNIVTFNALMSNYIEQGHFLKALDLLNDIKIHGLSPSPATISNALLAYRDMGDATGAVEFFSKFRNQFLREEFIKFNGCNWDEEFDKIEKFAVRICYQSLRGYLVKEPYPATKVLNLLAKMDSAQLKQDRDFLERLIWACTQEGHYVVAKEFYRRIREMHCEISLSVCNHVIWLMGKAKKWWAALEIYEDLLKEGPKPNNLSYELILSHFNILLAAARRRGIWRWGVRLLNKMEEKGLRPGNREWNAVLVACSKASETSAAVKIFGRMVERGEKPTVISYGALLSVLEKGGLLEEALGVWEHMFKVGVRPNLYAYTIFVSILTRQGKHEKVVYVLDEMSEHGVEPSVVTFNAIISGCAKNSMGAAALEWFRHMKVRNIVPNGITYDMVIEVMVMDGKPQLAYACYLRACEEKVCISSKSYDAVLDSCRAHGVFTDLNALGPRPVDKRKNIQIRKGLSEFCSLAGVPRRAKPFEKSELCSSIQKT